MTTMSLSSDWQMQTEPALLSRRFDFAVYADTRRFLDALAALSLRTGCYPDLTFSPTRVHLRIVPRAAALSEDEIGFAAEADILAQPGAGAAS